MTTCRVDTVPLIPNSCVVGGPGLGVLAQDIPFFGANGPSILFSDLDMPGDLNKSIRAFILAYPGAGDFFIFENGSFTWTNVPANTTSAQITYQLYTDGSAVGTPQVETITIGSNPAGPSMNGTLVFSSVTSTGYTVSWQAATALGGLSGYYIRIGSGDWEFLYKTTARVVTGRPNGYYDQIQVKAIDGLGRESPALSSFIKETDALSPSLIEVSGTATGTTTATGTVLTTESTGTLYRLASVNPSESAITVKTTGKTSPVLASGLHNVTFDELSPGTAYYAHYLHRDEAGNDSAVATSSPFTTFSSVDITPPVLSNPTGTPTSLTAATVSVTTNENNGILYRLVSPLPTHSALEIKSANSTSSVLASGVQSINVTGLSPGTTYYVHFIHRDAAGNDSNISVSASFTMQSADPVITGPSGSPGALNSTASLAENTISGPIFSTDIPLLGNFPTLTGADASRFTITPITATSWRVIPNPALNFEVPTDANTDNIYNFVFNASSTASQSCVLTCTNVNESPIFVGTIVVPVLTESQTFTPISFGSFFGDVDSGDFGSYSKIGTWPTGVDIAGTSIVGTPASGSAGNYNNLRIRRTDGQGLSVDSNIFSIVVQTSGAIVVPPPTNPAGMILLSTTLTGQLIII